jgi:uncharacterized protein YutD
VNREDNIVIVLAGGNAYIVEHEHKNGWNAEAFKERYSEVLERYDYIVGDWGYSQLRLRGFYQEGHPRATKESVIASLTDYLNEYCNFGCAFFVLTKTDASSVPPGTPDILQPAEPEPEPAADPEAVGEAEVQTAETAASAASSNGILMRWPLKERAGGPVRVPGAAAMARAAQEAERRAQQAQSGGRSGEGRSSSNRQGSDGGYGSRQSSRSSNSGPDKRSSPNSNAGQAEGRSSGRPGQGGRGPKPQQQERQAGGPPAKQNGQWRQAPADPARSTLEGGTRSPEPGGQKPDASKGGSRWQGKNRRRNRFGGKPNLPDGAPRDGGSPVNPGGGE